MPHSNLRESCFQKMMVVFSLLPDSACGQHGSLRLPSIRPQGQEQPADRVWVPGKGSQHCWRSSRSHLHRRTVRRVYFFRSDGGGVLAISQCLNSLGMRPKNISYTTCETRRTTKTKNKQIFLHGNFLLQKKREETAIYKKREDCLGMIYGRDSSALVSTGVHSISSHHFQAFICFE